MRSLTLIGLLLCLSACGIAYKSTSVRGGLMDGTKVRVIGLTPETALAANQQSYSPLQLPSAFRETASSAGSPRAGLPAPVNAVPPSQAPVHQTVNMPSPQAAEPYRIGVGDVVLMAATGGVPATGMPTLGTDRRQGYTVQDDGAIAIPDIGRVNVAGLTMSQAEGAVFQRLVEQQVDPSFSLEVAEFNARKVAIGGAVARPGVAPITVAPLTLDAAIAASGGFTAPARQEAVIRLYRDGALYEVPAAVFTKTPSYQKLVLKDGDAIFVDTDYDLAAAEAYFSEQLSLQSANSARMTALANEAAVRRNALEDQRSNFKDRLELGAEPRDFVYLAGEVTKQGRWPLPFEQKATLADALYETGGTPARTGDPSQIYVLRGSPDPRDFGAMTAWHLDGRTAAGLFLATRFELRPDDIIFIAQQPITKWERVLNQVTPSLISAASRN